MYLLFDRVYVKPMYLLDMERDRVIISPDATDELLEGIETKFRNLGEMFYNVDGYNKLVGGEGAFADDKEFFTWLADKGKVDLFVDSNAYHKIFVKCFIVSFGWFIRYFKHIVIIVKRINRSKYRVKKHFNG